MDTYYLSHLRFPKDHMENSAPHALLINLSLHQSPRNKRRGSQGSPPRTRGDLGPRTLARDRSFFSTFVMYVPIFGSPIDGPGGRPLPAASTPASQSQAVSPAFADIFGLGSDPSRRGPPPDASDGRSSSSASPLAARLRERPPTGLFALHFPHWSQMHKGIGKGEARLASHDQPCEFFSSSGLCSRWRRRPRLKGRCGHDRQRLRRAAGASS